jgi:uncharacterized protein YdaU (DUF1376 family)
MSSRPWMPFYVNDFRLDTLDLRADEIGVYVVMLMLAWRRDDAAIPNDMAWLKRGLKSCFASFHGHEFNRIVPKLLKRYFELGDDDLWRNKRLTLERQKADKLSAKQKQSADKRWGNVKENNVIAHPSAMPSQSQSQREERIGDFRKVGEGKPIGPRHGATSPSRGTTFIRHGTNDWSAYAEDFRATYGYEPEPNHQGGYWFKTAGAAPLPLRKATNGRA